MTPIIFHNPNCGTSRNTLAIMTASGEQPNVIEYLKTPPTREYLIELLGLMELSPRELLRQKGKPYDELGLDNPTLSDDELIDAMMAHPILMNRPIVVTSSGAALCRPSERVFELLDNPVNRFTKEDGETVQSTKDNSLDLSVDLRELPNIEAVELQPIDTARQ